MITQNEKVKIFGYFTIKGMAVLLPISLTVLFGLELGNT
jgi:hypothetical protein